MGVSGAEWSRALAVSVYIMRLGRVKWGRRGVGVSGAEWSRALAVSVYIMRLGRVSGVGGGGCLWS